MSESAEVTLDRIERPIDEPATAAGGLAEAQRGLLMSRAYYLVFYFCAINITAFANVYLQSLGLSGAQMGVISAITFFVAMFAPPLFGAIADRWQVHKPLMVALTFLTGVTALGFLGVSGFVGVLVMMIIGSVLRLSIPGILDASVLALARRANATYARQRLWGTIGSGAGSYLTGLLVTAFSISIIFWMQFVLMGVVATAIALATPIERTRQRVDYFSGLGRLIRVRQFRAVLVLVFVFGVGFSGNVSFLALYIISLGGAATLVGIALLVSTLVQIPSMYLSPWWGMRFGARNALVVAIFGVGAAYLLVGSVPNVWVIVAGLGLVGFFSGIFWSYVAPFILRYAPEGLSATALGLSGAATTGLGFACGALLGGLLWDAYGGGAIYVALFAAAALGGLFFYFTTRDK